MSRSAFLLNSAVLGFAFLHAVVFADDKPDARVAELQARAKTLVDRLEKEQFVLAGEHFDEAMKKALPAEKLGETWAAVTGKVGAFKKQKGSRFEKTAKYEIVFVTCEFEKAALDARVVFNGDREITGLFFAPSKQTPTYQPPAYVVKDSFREKEVTVGSGDWALPGTLSLPAGKGPFPALVLVHGSGAHDRDETIGPNLPFRDLAWGLASRGIAVLRYVKRTKQHAAKLAEVQDKFTLKEEVLDDALAAAALLRKTEEIDPKKVFILGHSLGAMCAPKMGALDPALAGLVCMAGNSRPFEDVLVEQLDYIGGLEGTSAEAKKQIDQLKEQAKGLKDLKLDGEVPASKLPFGMSVAYWRSLRDHDQLGTVKGLKMPMLFLQGERDYQVTMADLEGWKKALASNGQATFKSYPKLNHLFMEGEGKAKPAEYQKPGHVAGKVIEDIAVWIKKQ